MTESGAALNEVAALAAQLSALDKTRLIERVASDLQQDMATRGSTGGRSLYGLWADLGPAPSAEEIDRARREAWANFPRDDI